MKRVGLKIFMSIDYPCNPSSIVASNNREHAVICKFLRSREITIHDGA